MIDEFPYYQDDKEKEKTTENENEYLIHKNITKIVKNESEYLKQGNRRIPR